LQVYHYLDSFRSFREAQKNDPENVMSYVGQILAILQMDRYGDGLYFADEAIEKIKSISKRKPLTKTESAYFEFAKSLKMSSSMNYVKTPGIEIKSLQDAYVDVLRADGENTDGISLITWFAMPSLDDKYVREIYDTVLKRQPKNIGAHHALLHLSEMNSDEVNSTIHATALAALAPKSAHAQHMYGHTLPQKGKWSEALTYFNKANSIHISWAAKNDLDLNQDWHYSHNLDLMAAAYLGSGNLNKALETWKMATQDSRAIHHYIALLVVLGESNEANRWLTSLEKSGWEKYLKPLRVELELTTENKDSLSFAKDSGEESEYNKILKKIAQNYPNPSRDAQLSESISNYFSKKFKAGGFDGWSNAYIEMLRMKRVARIFKANWIIDDIQPLEYAIQNGSLCGSATKATSLTKCMQ
jgi:tetratricopeptide (TPR) repeat protein